ncbi:tetratricopeptide repeat protein [Sphingobium boeckii]|uniref:Putative Zn-dependent protease n=1 Tax=Sphingobium boeckii TaxID=1082345 RepID=A0A7W9AJ74_9SPHN|nr:tetratricopeptide repeat protein [Sphingobium boeckii]MBB5686625.1 putative Zn-dependent protease [Sphingobium boeckii]
MKGWQIIAVAALIALGGCTSSQEKANEYAATAAGLFDAGDYPAARLEIMKATAARDDVAEHWTLQGRIELALNAPVNAYQAYSRALDLDATNQEALQIVTEVGFQVGRVREAGAFADRLLALNPNATRAMLIKGLIALENRRLPEAEGFADKMLAINPNDEGGIVMKARVLALGGKRADAIQILKDGLLKVGEGDAITATTLEVYRADGDLANMLPLFETLTGKSPKNYDLKIDFANALYKSGDIVRARMLLSAVMTEQPDNRELIDKISALWAEYDRDPLSAAQLAQLQEDGSLIQRMAIARHLLAQGRPMPAEAILRPVADAATALGMADARSLYARVLDAQGQAARAGTIIAAVLKDDTNNSDALVLRAQQALKRADADSAINDAQIVVRDDPANELGYIVLAQGFEARKQIWRVRQVYEQAINDHPENYALVAHFRDFLYRINDKARAMSVSREYALANPASLRGWNLFASTCARLNDSACASEAKAGRDKALHTYTMDERPGARRPRGLFGKL